MTHLQTSIREEAGDINSRGALEKGTVARVEVGAELLRVAKGCETCRQRAFYLQCMTRLLGLRSGRPAAWSGERCSIVIQSREEVLAEEATEVHSKLSEIRVWGQGRGGCQVVQRAPVVGANKAAASGALCCEADNSEQLEASASSVLASSGETNTLKPFTKRHTFRRQARVRRRDAAPGPPEGASGRRVVGEGSLGLSF